MHLHFDSDDEGGLAGPLAPAAGHAAPHAAFSASPGFQCVSSVRVDYDKDQCYVFQMVHSPGTGIVAAALSNKRIKLFNLG